MENDQLQDAAGAAGAATAQYTVYRLRPGNDPIVVQVFPGDAGQAALTDMKLGGTSILSGETGAIQNRVIGTANSLVAQELEVETVITAMPGGTNNTTFHIEVTGGAQPYFCDMSKMLGGPGDSVIYKTVILFSR